MKYIVKSPEPEVFASWKAARPGATYNEGLGRAPGVKRALKTSLLQEQKFLCCYCECRIDADHSHIEHFRPKGMPEFSALQLDYGNLHASCTRQPTGSSEEHCGHKKGDSFSDDLVSPLESDCATHFKFTFDGSIEGLDEKGRTTIDILHLDSALLNSQRKKLIEYFLDLDDELVALEVSSHLDETKPKSGEFYSMIKALYGDM